MVPFDHAEVTRFGDFSIWSDETPVLDIYPFYVLSTIDCYCYLVMLFYMLDCVLTLLLLEFFVMIFPFNFSYLVG